MVKRSITRWSDESVHPERARELISAGAAAALGRIARIPVPAIELPARLELTFLTSDMAEMATWVRGVERTGARTVAATDAEPLRLYRTFVTLINLTRAIVDR